LAPGRIGRQAAGIYSKRTLCGPRQKLHILLRRENQSGES
jgi:hypothetical protein